MQAVWLSFALMVVCYVGLIKYMAPLKPSPLALQMPQSPQAFADIVRSWSPEHLERFHVHLLYDVLLMGAYASFGYLLATRTGLFQNYPPAIARFAPWALPLAAAFDLVENYLHWRLTSTMDVPSRGAVVLCAFVTTTKWILALGFGLLALIGFMKPA